MNNTATENAKPELVSYIVRLHGIGGPDEVEDVLHKLRYHYDLKNEMLVLKYIPELKGVMLGFRPDSLFKLDYALPMMFMRDVFWCYKVEEHYDVAGCYDPKTRHSNSMLQPR